MEFSEQHFEVCFHNIDYLVALRTEGGLNINIEERLTGSMWKGEYSSKYVEEITQKTGSLKKYEVFVKMLVTGIKRESESVFVDLLTYHDLELLKTRKVGGKESGNSSIQSSGSLGNKFQNKRYLILTYCGEFDRVHYPLSLTLEENPPTDSLQRTITRLRNELEMLRTHSSIESSQSSAIRANGFLSGLDGSTAQIHTLFDENEKLKKKLVAYEKARPSAVDLDQIHKENSEKNKVIMSVKKDAELTIKSLMTKLEDAEKELETTRSELFRTRSELGHYDTTTEGGDVESLRSQLGDVSSQLEEERHNSRSIIEQQQKDIDYHIKSIDNLKGQDRKSKVRIKQLENELEMSIKKLNIQMYGRSRPNSTSSQKSAGSTGSYNSVKGSGYGRTYNNVAPRASSVPQRKNYSPAAPANRRNTPTRTGNNNIYSRNTRVTPQRGGGSGSGSGTGSGNNTPQRQGALYGRNNYRPNYSPAYRNSRPAPNPAGNSAGARNSPGYMRPTGGRTNSNPRNVVPNNKQGTPTNNRLYGNNAPSNRLYSPNGQPRVRQPGASPGVANPNYRARPAVGLKQAHQAKPGIPNPVRQGGGAVGAYAPNKLSTGGTSPATKSQAAGSAVFDRLYGSSKPRVLNTDKSRQPPKPEAQTPKKTPTPSEPLQPVLGNKYSSKENLTVDKENIENKPSVITSLKKVDTSAAALAEENEKLQKINQEIEKIDVKDIDDRLSKLQDLIKYAKS